MGLPRRRKEGKAKMTVIFSFRLFRLFELKVVYLKNEG
jgi:hypothetical protein